MTIVERTLLRENLVQSRQEFERLDAEGEVSAKACVLFEGMFRSMEMMTTLLLERNTPITSGNSSMPSSMTQFDKTAKSRPGSRSKGCRPDPEANPNVHTEVSQETIPVEHCQECGEDLSGVLPFEHEERVLVDIEMITREQHFQSEAKRCPGCHATTRGPFPEPLSGPLQYGDGVVAMAVDFLVRQLVPMRHTAEVLFNLSGRQIAEATLSKWILRVYHALEDWERHAIDRILTAPVMHVDETSIRVNRGKHWIHTSSAEDLVLKNCHPKRGQEALQDINIVPRFGDRSSGDEDDSRPVLVHDRWAPYFKYDECAHALCGSHLVRNLQQVIDATAPRWAIRLQKLLLWVCHALARSDDKVLSPTRLKWVWALWDAILEEGLAELPEPPPRKGKRGKWPKSKAEKLHQALVKHKNEVLCCTLRPEVPFTNNRAERDLRMAKTKQKVSGTFRSPQHAQAYCRISSYLQSAANQKVGSLAAIRLALQGKALELLD